MAVFIKTSPHASPSQVLNPQDRPNGLIKDFQACWSHSVPTLFYIPLLMFTDLLGLGTLQPLLLAATTAATIFSNPHRWMNIEPVLAIFSCESWRLLRITTLECSHPSGAAHNIITDQLSTLSIQPISCRDAVAASLQDNAIVSWRRRRASSRQPAAYSVCAFSATHSRRLNQTILYRGSTESAEI